MHNSMERRKENMRLYVYLILALILALLVTVFAVQNNAAIEITLLFWTIEGSMALALMITLAIGILIGLLVSSLPFLRQRVQVSALKRKSGQLEKQIADLKAAQAESRKPVAEVEQPKPEAPAENSTV